MHRLADFGPTSAQHDFLQPPFGGLQLFLAMQLQQLAALIQRDGILKIHLALLQPGNDGLQFLERALERQLVYGGSGFCGGGYDFSPTDF